MMKATNISAGAAQSGYYKAEGYYSSDSEAGDKSAEWYGKGAQALGLEGSVDDFLFERLLNGETFEKGPSGLIEGRIMGKWENGERKHRAGIDLTFSAPKAMSIAALVFKDERVLDVHKEAVKATLEIVEKELVGTRRSVGGKMVTETGGKIIAGLFLHDTSRSLDPQMHTHAAIANMVMNEDGSYTALSNEQIMKAVKFGSEVYRSYVAKGMEKIGYTVEREGQHRLISLKEVPQAVLDLFSKRSQEIDKAVKEHGAANVPKNRELAALATRVTKDTNIDRDKLHSEWVKEAKENGIDIATIAKNIEQTREREVNYVEPILRTETKEDLAHQAVLKGIAHVSETATIYSKSDVLKAATNFADDAISPKTVLEGVDSAIKTKTLLPAQDYSVLGKAAEQMYTDPESLLIEKKIVNSYRLTQNRSQLPRTFEGRSIESALSQRLRFTSLSEGQKDAITVSLTGRSQFVGVQGYAGTGKTFMLTEAVNQAEKHGFTVEGLAPSNQATRLLKEAIPTAETLQARITRGGAPQGATDPKKTIVFVDEASFISNKDMLNFMEQAREKQYARVVLLGDVKQLDGVEAGTPFALLQKVNMPTATMIDIVRQRDDNLRSAVHHSIAGEIKEAFDKIGSNIVVPEDKDYAKGAADHFLYLGADQRSQAIITTPSNDVRRSVNDHVRSGLKDEGSIGAHDVDLKVLVAERLSKVQAQEPHSYRDGDVVVSRESIKSAGLSKGGVYDVSIDNAYANMTLTNRKTGEIVDFEPTKSNRVALAIDLFKETTQPFSTGEPIKFGIADKKYGINNGDRGQIIAIDDTGVSVNLKDGKDIKLPNDALALKGMDYAYSLTAHGVQGASVEHIILAMGSREYLADQKGFYVGISRGVDKATLVTDDPIRLAKRLEKQTGERIGSLEAYGLALKEQDKLADEKARVAAKWAENSASKEAETARNFAEKTNENDRNQNTLPSQHSSSGDEKPTDRETKTNQHSSDKDEVSRTQSADDKTVSSEIDQLKQNVRDAAEQKERGERN